MDMKEYTTSAVRTESIIDAVNLNSAALITVLNLFIQAGNLLDILKKNQFYGKPIPVDRWNERMQAIHLISGSAEAVLTDLQTDLRTPELKLDIDPRVFHAIVGIATEATELVEGIYPTVIGLGDFDSVNLSEEGLGDVCWYQAILADSMGVDWEDKLKINIAKLKKRYPDKFTEEAAINRDLVAERKILEGKCADE